MTNRARVVLLGAALVVAVVAFVALRPSDDESEPGQSTSPTRTTAREPERPAARSAEPPLLRAGNVRGIKVKSGEIVRFAARSTEDDEVHVHGYDLTRQAPAGKTVVMRFRADIQGVFEIELERSGEPIGRLEVRP